MVPGVVAATPDKLTTPFFNADVSGVTPPINDTLQKAVMNLLDTTPAYASIKRSIAVALVDLSGPKKFAPDYATFNGLSNFYAASTSKVCGLLSAYQLLADANEFLRNNPGISNIAALDQALKQIWSQRGIRRNIIHWSPRCSSFRRDHHPVSFCILTSSAFDTSDGNQNGSTAIVLLRFPLIAQQCWRTDFLVR